MTHNVNGKAGLPAAGTRLARFQVPSPDDTRWMMLDGLAIQNAFMDSGSR